MTGGRHLLRQTLRRRRAALPPAARREAERRICRRIATHPAFRRARSVALYIACGSEADLWPLIHIARQAGKRVFLPRVEGRVLHFVPIDRHTPMRRGAFGIAEPRQRRRPAWRLDLDLVIAPLVGFDERGNRLGQGGGYYDRALAARLATSWRRPLFAGAAFEVQACASLTAEHWDVPLDFVVTERRIVAH